MREITVQIRNTVTNTITEKTVETYVEDWLTKVFATGLYQINPGSNNKIHEVLMKLSKNNSNNFYDLPTTVTINQKPAQLVG